MRKMATGIWNSIKAEGKEWRDAYKNREMYKPNPSGLIGRAINNLHTRVGGAESTGLDVSHIKNMNPSLLNATKRSFTSSKALTTAGSAAAGGGAAGGLYAYENDKSVLGGIVGGALTGAALGHGLTGLQGIPKARIGLMTESYSEAIKMGIR